MSKGRTYSFTLCCMLSVILTATGPSVAAQLDLGAEELVQANGTVITVHGYSVPSYADWNSDGLNDLIIGEGGNWETPKIRVYLNQGSVTQPSFSDYFYAEKASGGNIAYVGDECTCSAQGLFPRLVYWDADERKDLLVGQLDGTIMVYLNVGTSDDPVFDDGSFLQVGEAGSKINIDVEDLAAPSFVDWDNDGARDLVVGALDGKIHLFINYGTDNAPDFVSETFAQEDGSALVVHALGSSPVILDLDDDGRKDLLIGDSAGQLLAYPNVGTDAAPTFSGHSLVQADSVTIEVDAVTGASPRARPFVCDWTNNGLPDVLVGAGDGKVYLYQDKSAADDTTGSICAGIGIAIILAACTAAPLLSPARFESR